MWYIEIKGSSPGFCKTDFVFTYCSNLPGPISPYLLFKEYIIKNATRKMAHTPYQIPPGLEWWLRQLWRSCLWHPGTWQWSRVLSRKVSPSPLKRTWKWPPVWSSFDVRPLKAAAVFNKGEAENNVQEGARRKRRSVSRHARMIRGPLVTYQVSSNHE